MQNINVGFIGSGFIAGAHAAALQRLGGVHLAACCDVNLAAAEALSAWTGCKASVDMAEVIEASDAVWVCTPPGGHLGQVLACLEAGRSVYCDKPLAVTLEDGQAIVDAASQSEAQTAIGFNCRFHAPWQQAKSALDAGELGEARMFYATRMGWGTQVGWRRDPAQLCGMTIESISHDVDLLRWLLGDVSEVSARTLATDPSQPQFDNCLIANLNMACGAIAGIQASWASAVPISRHGLIGTAGTLVIEGPRLFEFTALRQASPGGGTEQTRRYSAAGIDVTGACKHFIDAIRGEADLQIPIADGLRSLEVCTALIESARAGGTPIAIKEPNA